jgi:hypothetical protein
MKQLTCPHCAASVSPFVFGWRQRHEAPRRCLHCRGTIKLHLRANTFLTWLVALVGISIVTGYFYHPGLGTVLFPLALLVSALASLCIESAA